MLFAANLPQHPTHQKQTNKNIDHPPPQSFVSYKFIEMFPLQVMHGGLFKRDDVKLEELRTIDRNRQPGEEGISTLKNTFNIFNA